jgi:hypothetical protein
MPAIKNENAHLEVSQLSLAEAAKPMALVEDTPSHDPIVAEPENVSDTKSNGVPKTKVAPATKVETEERSIFPGPQISPREQAEINKADLT